MIIGLDYLRWAIVITVVLSTIVCRVVSVSTVCELSVIDNNKLYNYSLATPTPEFPHGVLSEDGFYKVAVNETVVWFQLCDGMIFNHDPPKCIDCWDCGGPSHCGMDCSALMGVNIGVYHNWIGIIALPGVPPCMQAKRYWQQVTMYAPPLVVPLGQTLKSLFKNLADEKNPHVGVIVNMSNTAPERNCSLSVSVICDSNGVQGPHSLEKLGTCDYATVLRHPSGCATIVQFHGKGWGWLSTFIIITFCLFGGYLLAGTVYRHFILGVRGIEIIPNLDFWTGLPQRTQSSFMSLVQKFRRPSQSHRSSYSPVNF